MDIMTRCYMRGSWLFHVCSMNGHITALTPAGPAPPRLAMAMALPSYQLQLTLVRVYHIHN